MKQEGDPFLSISFEDVNGNALKNKIPDPRAFRAQVSNDRNKITYKWNSKQNLSIERVYWRESNESYVFHHQTKILPAHPVREWISCSCHLWGTISRF